MNLLTLVRGGYEKGCMINLYTAPFRLLFGVNEEVNTIWNSLYDCHRRVILSSRTRMLYGGWLGSNTEENWLCIQNKDCLVNIAVFSQSMQSVFKVVASCKKPRVVACRPWTWDYRIGLPTFWYSRTLFWNGYVGNWNILVPTGKENNSDSLSKGDRKGSRTNRTLIRNYKGMWCLDSCLA